MLTLTRPLVFLDLETTGNQVATDRIVEFYAMKIHPNGNRDALGRRVNPGMPMSEEAAKITGITDEALAGEPPFALSGVILWQFLEGCDLAGFGLKNFDVPLLWEEFHRIGLNWDLTNVKVIDSGNIFKKKEGRSLSDALRFYCGREHVGAHGAEADALATADVLIGQLERYGDLPRDVAELAAFSSFDNRVDLAGKIILDGNGDAVYSFGKHQGQKVADYPGFALWMLGKEFPAQTKFVLRALLQKKHGDSEMPF